jgi:hypothetical protein
VRHEAASVQNEFGGIFVKRQLAPGTIFYSQPSGGILLVKIQVPIRGILLHGVFGKGLEKVLPKHWGSQHPKRDNR